MGSSDHDTQRTNPAGVGNKNNNHAATEAAETEEMKHLKSQYKDQLTKLQEIYSTWSEADLLSALNDNQGSLEITIGKISEGHVVQWGEVKSRKSKKEHSSKNKQSGQQFSSANAQRGHQRGGYSDRGRARGEGGRGGRNNDRTRGRRENGPGYNRPPRQQNGTNTSNHDDTNHGKAYNTSSSKNNNDSIEGNWNTNNTNEGTAAERDWSADIVENPAENAKGSSTNDSTDKAQSSWSKENPTDSSKSGWNATTDNSTENNKDSWVADASTDNLTASRDIVDKATDSLKHNRDSNSTKDNWDTDHPKDNWGAENDSWADSNWSSDNFGADTTKSGKNMKEMSKSPNAVMRSVAPTKSPVSRTIPSKSKASWAQIVKPESKPEPKSEPISTPIHKSPEIVKTVSPQISKSPNPVQSPPAPKVTESVIVPPQETLTTTSVVTSKTEDMKEYVKETSSPEAPTATSVSSTPVVNVSPRDKEVSPPGLHKTKTATSTRRLKQDAPVVMPSTGAGLEKVGVQFGSLSISNSNTVEESSETETQIVPQVQKTEERSSPVSVETSPQLQTTPIQQQQQIVQQQAVQQLQQQQVSQQQVAQQQATQQQLQQQAAQQLLQQQAPQSAQPQPSTLSQSNSINRLPTTSAQALPSSIGSAPTGTPANTPNPTLPNFNPSNPSYFKQQDQSSAAYLNQQHHLGLATEQLNAAPYTSYLPNQPPNQLSGFGIGPIQSIPEYNAMYGPDAQRIMGYYDPTYGQASPVTSTGYQGRDNKYTSDTATNTNSQATNQQSTGTQQSTNQQGGQNPQQQQAYPLGVPYYPYYYMANQFPSAYQQSGYGQPFKSIYPMYNHPHSTKPGSASGASPYGYPTTPTTPNTPHHYSHTSNTGYDEVTAAQIHHHPGLPSTLDYQKPYSGIPPLNFLGNAGGNNPQPAGSANSNTTGGKSSNNGSSELNASTQYKAYQEKTSTNAQSAGGVGQTGTQQHQQPNPNYYGQQQQAQQMFNNYQHPQTHQYYPHQAHHQATNRNQQPYWTNSQS